MAVRRPWLAFAALSLLYFLVSAGTFNALGVVLPAMVGDLHWNWREAGLGYALLGVACGLTSLAAAGSIRRYGVRPTLLAGGAMLAIGFAAMALTHSVWVYLAAASLIGIAFSFCTSVPGTYVLTAIFERRSTIVGAYFTLGALGGVAGPKLVTSLSALAGWRGFWWAFAAASVVTAGIAAAATPNRVDHAPGVDVPPDQVGPGRLLTAMREVPVRWALAAPQFYVIVGAYTMYMLINTTAHGFAVEHLIERGVTPNAAANVLSFEALIGAVVSAIGGIAGERVSAKTLLIICLVSLIGGMTALAFAHGPLLMAVFAVGVGVGFGLSFVAATMLLLSYFGRGVYLELYSIMCLVSTLAALGPALGGWARDEVGGFQGVFLICALAAFVMLVASTVLKRPAET
ncbi:MAG TPA: MFS transporter [Caulobacteraceae bacterium]|jgi:MFS family permease